MRALTFELKSIPDLSLVKYSTLGARGVGGVLDAHLAFLRLFAHRPGPFARKLDNFIHGAGLKRSFVRKVVKFMLVRARREERTVAACLRSAAMTDAKPFQSARGARKHCSKNPAARPRSRQAL